MMNRRMFFSAGLGGTLTALTPRPKLVRSRIPDMDAIRSAFPRMEHETYLNAAGMMPLSTFSQAGLQRYLAFQQLGSGDGRGGYVQDMLSQIRGLFADLIGAEEQEIGMVHCTKAGEQIALDALVLHDSTKNVVTNDLHFSGSLHNLVGLQRQGRDVRIVTSRDWGIDLDEMGAAIDARTALVAVSLVSNINGHVEDIKALAEIAHAHGALLYADIIQAAGIVPIDVKALDIDIAACSCYKWLHGVHGTGFVYVRDELQGSQIPDRLFPGSVRHNYAPWIENPNADHASYIYNAPTDARRYQPGHISYMGYCAAYEGLTFIHEVGVERALEHSLRLNAYLKQKLDASRFRCITPEEARTPICTFVVPDPDSVKQRLADANVVVSFSGNRMRVSPALYNNAGDVDRLVVAVLG